MKGKSILQIILYVVLWLYIVISQIMTVVFWWEMMLEDNIIATIFIDPFIAEIKGVLWPFFI
jgi:hypothetical protein